MSPRRSFRHINQKIYSENGYATDEEAGRQSVTAVAGGDQMEEVRDQGKIKERIEGSGHVWRSVRDSGNEVEGLRDGSGKSLPQSTAECSTIAGAIFSEWLQKNPYKVTSGYVGQVRPSLTKEPHCLSTIPSLTHLILPVQVAYLWPSDAEAVKQAIRIARKLKK